MAPGQLQPSEWLEEVKLRTLLEQLVEAVCTEKPDHFLNFSIAWVRKARPEAAKAKHADEAAGDWRVKAGVEDTADSLMAYLKSISAMEVIESMLHAALRERPEGVAAFCVDQLFALRAKERSGAEAEAPSGEGRFGIPVSKAAAGAAAAAASTATSEPSSPGKAATLGRYAALVRNVKLFSTLGEPEIAAAARALEAREFSAGEVIIRQGDTGSDCWFIESGECFASVDIDGAAKEVMQYTGGGFFGERALLRSEPRAATVTARTAVSALRLSSDAFMLMIRERDHKEDLVRGVKMFETMSDEQIAKLAGAMTRQQYAEGESLIVQGAAAHDFYILELGECVATITTGGQEQEVKRYRPGELFGEKALLDDAPRAATIRAVGGSVGAFKLSRVDFEAQLGPLSQLQAEAYLADPRKLIADYYRPGDERGPSGSAEGMVAPTTSWFAVYRPCSRDSIAKMLGRIGVGKGLNVKGKSAKKNRLSGFVPFIQISDNSHKSAVEASPQDARTKIFYRSANARDEAMAKLAKVLESAPELVIDRREMSILAEYEPDSFGIDVPEPLMKEAYIMRPDLSPLVGWETGRASEPAFMDMNMHAVRDEQARPAVCLYQFDLADAMNPLGLLVAYAEKSVKPVVSDFDTFTIGSKGMRYEATPPKQVELIHWALKHTEGLLENPKGNFKGWSSCWLQVLKQAANEGFHPELPKYGFGDPTSYRLVGDVVSVVEQCGAVRHGAECFNFYFPQELDDEFLVVWDGFSPAEPPWRSMSEPELRAFLIERARVDGYSFPINPVWPVRDPGWGEVLEALRSTDEGAANLSSWFPPESGVLGKIGTLHSKYPRGFTKDGGGEGTPQHGSTPRKLGRKASQYTNAADLTGIDLVHFATAQVNKVITQRWRRIRKKLISQLKLGEAQEGEGTATLSDVAGAAA